MHGQKNIKFILVLHSQNISGKTKKKGEGEGTKTIKKYQNIFISYNFHYLQNRNAHSNLRNQTFLGAITFFFQVGGDVENRN